MDSTTILEVNAISFQQISVCLQHPYEESMVTIEFNFGSGNGMVQCTIYSINHNYSLLSAKLTAVVQKCLSIPVTIRSMLRFWDQERIKMFQRGLGQGQGGIGGATTGSSGFGNFNMGIGTNDPGGATSRSVMGGHISGVKLESNMRQQQMPSSTVAANSTAGFIKFKPEVKEDFHESPKSTHLSAAVESISSLGQNQNSLSSTENINQTIDQNESVPQSDIEIADKYKNIWKEKTNNIKNCLSITPILNESKNQHQNVDLKRSAGIEIIPLSSSANAIATGSIASSTITITPITAGGKDKKTCINTNASSTSNVSSKRTYEAAAAEAQKEKKRKKKRDDSPMGPPEKVYSRQNSPATNSDAAAVAVAVARKFSSPASSPKGPLLSSSSPSSSSRPSPKHSPVYSSPKHTMASPTHSHSPKHGSSGKPSMSTLKSAAASPKSEKSSNISIGQMSSKSREKEKVSSVLNVSNITSKPLNTVAGHNSNIKTMTSLNSMLGGYASGTNNNSGTVASIDLMRKGVSLMTTDQQSPSIAVQSTQQQQTILTQQVQVPGNNDVKTSALMSTEYMVKTSQEGLKMTINKTNNKSTLKKSKSSSTLSSDSTVSLNSAPKRSHTGLKVGVSSGPSSKKNGHINHMFNSSTSSLNSCSSSSGVSSTKTSFHKSNSSGNLLGKLSSNSSKHSDSNSLSPKKMPNSKLDHHVDMLKILQYASPTMAANMEGFMKGLNSKFQIPKLSQRAASSNSNENSSSSTASAITTSDCNNSSNSLSNISPSTTQQSVSLHILKSPMVPTTNTAQMEDTTPLLSTTLNAK